MIVRLHALHFPYCMSTMDGSMPRPAIRGEVITAASSKGPERLTAAVEAPISNAPCRPLEVTDVAYTFALVGTALLGFMAGLFSFKVKSQWCPTCGLKLTCSGCQGAGGNQVRTAR
jgi:hypothetical protein